MLIELLMDTSDIGTYMSGKEVRCMNRHGHNRDMISVQEVMVIHVDPHEIVGVSTAGPWDAPYVVFRIRKGGVRDGEDRSKTTQECSG